MPVRVTATNALAVVAVLGFVAARTLFDTFSAHYFGGFVPARMSGLFLETKIPVFLTPLSAAFLHADFLHLLFNTVVLLYCGHALEARVGPARLLALFILGAYFSALAQWYVDPAAALPMIGASGAVSALLGAYALTFGSRRRLVRAPRLNRLLNAAWLLVFWVGLQYALDIYGQLEGTLIATPAHIGGFLAGLALQRWVVPGGPHRAPPAGPIA